MTFILFGLTVVASSMNLLVLRFLTMNTEDERREEIQSAVARSSLRFDSDIISPNGTAKRNRNFCRERFSIIYLGTLIPSSLSPDQFDYLATELTPSESEPCHCCSCFTRKRKERKKFTVRRMPGKIAHLVPMQRIDSMMLKRNLSVPKPSNTDYNQHSSTKLPPMTTSTSNHEIKTSLDNPSTSGWPPPPPFSSQPVNTSTSIHSLKPSYEHNNDSDKTKLQTILSRFRQDTELIPLRLDVNVKRSSV